MAINEIVNRENVVVLLQNEEGGLEYNVDFMGQITPEHEGFYIPGFQIVDLSKVKDKCFYKTAIEEDKTLAKGGYKNCLSCKGYNCGYNPSRKLNSSDIENYDEAFNLEAAMVHSIPFDELAIYDPEWVKERIERGDFKDSEEI